jgi:hypothetical protein
MDRMAFKDGWGLKTVGLIEGASFLWILNSHLARSRSPKKSVFICCYFIEKVQKNQVQDKLCALQTKTFAGL